MDIPNGVPEHFQNQNIYFYYGWAAHASGVPSEHRVVSDWRWGWMEREKMVRGAIHEAIAEGVTHGLACNPGVG
jgi:hypothetical protein